MPLESGQNCTVSSDFVVAIGSSFMACTALIGTFGKAGPGWFQANWIWRERGASYKDSRLDTTSVIKEKNWIGSILRRELVEEWQKHTKQFLKKQKKSIRK